MKLFVRTLLLIAGVTTALILFLFAQEVWRFANSDEVAAQEEAKRAFVSECASRQFNSDQYKGPQRIRSPKGTYGFLWQNPSNGDQIVTMTRYFPWGTEAWYSKGEENQKFETY